MKKLLLSSGLSAALLLAACGSDEPTKEENAEMEEDFNESSAAATEEVDEEMYGFDLSNSTENIMEFATNPDIDVYVDESSFTAYHKLGTYTNERSDENGTISSKDEDFPETLNVLLVEDDLGTKSIAVVGEQINNTDEILHSSPSHKITTDTMEQIEGSSLLNGLGGMYEPNTKHQGIILAELNFPDETPKEVNITFDGIHNTHEDEYSDGPAYYADDYFIQYEEMKFTLME